MRTLILAAALAAVAAPALADSITLPVTIRDFRAGTPTDFEGAISGFVPGLVETALGADDNPVLAMPYGRGAIAGLASFATWYNDTPGTNTTIAQDLTFNETAPGSGIYRFADNSFFPIDGLGFGDEGRSHNYHFTLELASSFTYQPGQTFSFTGDDDLWVFIDDQLVVDLGGVHGALNGSVDLDTLGLTAGQNYAFNLFFAERHTTQSNFIIETSIALIPTPAPAMLGVFGLGLAGLGLMRRRG